MVFQEFLQSFLQFGYCDSIKRALLFSIHPRQGSLQYLTSQASLIRRDFQSPTPLAKMPPMSPQVPSLLEVFPVENAKYADKKTAF